MANHAAAVDTYWKLLIESPTYCILCKRRVDIILTNSGDREKFGFD